MYHLPCQNCSSFIFVAPSQAGDEVTCANCGIRVTVPKLGELRKLPRQDEDASGTNSSTDSAESTTAPRIGFVAAALAATASLLVAGFCTVRWAMVDVPMTTTEHIADYDQAYQKASPAALILDFEEMEERGLELPTRYNYKTLQVTKQTWGRNALVAGAIGTISLLAAILLSMSGRKARVV